MASVRCLQPQNILSLTKQWLVGIAATVAAVASALPAGAVTLNIGDILVADQDAAGGSGAVIRVDPTTGAQTVVSSGGNFVNPYGIVVVPIPEPSSIFGFIAFGGLAGRTIFKQMRQNKSQN